MNKLIIDGKEIQLSDETVREFKKQFGIEDELPKTWEDLGVISGWYVNSQAEVKFSGKSAYNNELRDIFPTRAEAEASIALAQLCQFRDRYNGEPIDEWCNWKDGKTKYIIHFVRGELLRDNAYGYSHILVFKTAELRDRFLENFKDLIEQAKPLL